MAFPTVRSSNTSIDASDVTTHSIVLPATIVADDLLILITAQDGRLWETFPAGWTELENADHGAVGFAVFAKIAVGDEDSTTIQPTTGNAQQSSHVSLAIRDWSGDIGDVEGTFATSTDSAPNPPSHSASSGGSADRLWLAVCGMDEGNSSGVSAYPYADNNLNQDSSGSSGVAVGVCSDELTGVTQDPGTFTIGSSTLWGCGTISVEPAASGSSWYYYANQ